MSCMCGVNERLEAERLDVTFREPKFLCDKPHFECNRNHFERCKKPHNPICDRQHLTANVEKLFFNAGRYAAGARDSVAVQADAELQERLS
jgi:hypothetical protein